MQKTLGGDRLGSGNKLKVELHNYERSTHDMSYLWRSTIAAGTLVPFICEVALPGDTFDINLNCDIKTHPTIGPLFGTYKVQLDVFQAPIRLYNALLHNNSLGIGLNMSQVVLPTITLQAQDQTGINTLDLDNSQINPSCLLSYLGLRGIGICDGLGAKTRAFNATAILAYWEIYKNYYSNKQEEIGAVIHTPNVVVGTTPSAITLTNGGSPLPVTTYPGTSPITLNWATNAITITYSGTPPNTDNIIFSTEEFGDVYATDLGNPYADSGTVLSTTFNKARWGSITVTNWRMKDASDPAAGTPSIETFPLANIDEMRKNILSTWTPSAAFDINTSLLTPLSPYKNLVEVISGFNTTLNSQEGLALKTYQSDLFNNWLKTEYIDGPGGISEVTAIDTTGGSFTIDTLNLSKKVYDMLNRIAVSGGTYDDWLDVVYTHERYTRCESPIYHGGLIKELVFEEVVSNSESESQPLGTIAGKGRMGGKHKGGNVVIKVDEPSYIIGIISLTPRIDYSQGNNWHVNLQTLDDLHKPALDEIGFQELICEQLSWWSTHHNGTEWIQQSAGKQPAWLNYMTNANQARGNFAIANNEMFMTLNRRYQADGSKAIEDLTTYIDPSKYNFIFAETALDSQNFWAQIAVNMTARRKMSAKLMPNL